MIRNIYPKPRTIVTFKVRLITVGIGDSEKTLTFNLFFSIFYLKKICILLLELNFQKRIHERKNLNYINM